MVVDVADARRSFRGRSVISTEDFQKEDFLVVLEACLLYTSDAADD